MVYKHQNWLVWFYRNLLSKLPSISKSKPVALLLKPLYNQIFVCYDHFSLFGQLLAYFNVPFTCNRRPLKQVLAPIHNGLLMKLETRDESAEQPLSEFCSYVCKSFPIDLPLKRFKTHHFLISLLFI